MNNETILIKHIENSINNAEIMQSKLIPEVVMKNGLSSIKNRHFFNNICSLENSKYLEIGTALGSTFVSSVFNNNIDATCIDVWSQECGKQHVDINSKVEFLNNLTNTIKHQKRDILQKISIFDQDCFTIPLEKIGNNFNVFLYDGDHSLEATRKAFSHFKDILSDYCIIIVDDWNCEDIRNGTKLGFEDAKFKVVKAWSMPGKTGDWAVFSDYWWNGLFVALIKKS